MWSNRAEEKEFKKIVENQKLDYVASLLGLLCTKKYGQDVETDKEVEALVYHLKYQRPKVYEALYDYAYEKLSKFFNEDGTVNELCENWEEII